MPSTQPSLSTEKVNADVGLINQQPPPALAMSTDRNGPGQRAMRLRGGCCVRHSSVLFQFQLLMRSLANRNTLLLLQFKDLLLRGGKRWCNLQWSTKVCFCVLSHIPITYTYSRTSSKVLLLSTLSTLSSWPDSRIVISDAAVERWTLNIDYRQVCWKAVGASDRNTKRGRGHTTWNEQDLVVQESESVRLHTSNLKAPLFSRGSKRGLNDSGITESLFQ
jgi:hypothetical protein